MNFHCFGNNVDLPSDIMETLVFVKVQGKDSGQDGVFADEDCLHNSKHAGGGPLVISRALALAKLQHHVTIKISIHSLWRFSLF